MFLCCISPSVKLHGAFFDRKNRILAPIKLEEYSSNTCQCFVFAFIEKQAVVVEDKAIAGV